MKHLYLLMLVCLSFSIFCMELPFGPNKGAIRAAVRLFEKGSPQEKQEGLKILLEPSLKSDPEVLYTLGCTYEKGAVSQNKELNQKLTFQYMKKAADMNYGPAFIKMGQYYNKGFGTQANQELAIEYYKKARERYSQGINKNDGAAVDNAKVAEIQLAKIYLFYYKNDQDRVNQSIQILKNYVEKFRADAAIILAQYYDEVNDPQNAESYFLEALKLKPNDEAAQVQLANLYIHRFSNNAQKMQQAENYLKKAVAKSNNQIAAFKLGLFYYDHEQFKQAIETLEKITESYFFVQKFIHEGLIYSHERNEFRDPSKALSFFEKALKLDPHNDFALYGVWKIWLESPELIEDQERIKDILEKLPTTKNAQVLFRLGIGYQYGIYGLEKNNEKAEEFFKKILADTSTDSDVLKAIIYADGIGVKKDLTQALKSLERSRLKSTWINQLYLRLHDAHRQELIQEEESAKQKLVKKESKRVKAPLETAASSLSLAPKAQEPAKETPESGEFTQEPEDPAQQQEFKQELIKDINEKYKPHDGSFVHDIDFIHDVVTIDDPRHHKKIILSFKELPKNKGFKRVIKKLQYDKRVEEWFTENPEKLKEKYPDPTTIENHTFAQIVDSYIQLYGQEVPRSDNKREFFMHGEIINTKTNKHLTGTFEYTFYQDQKDGPWVLYHRLFRPNFPQ